MSFNPFDPGNMPEGAASLQDIQSKTFTVYNEHEETLQKVTPMSKEAGWARAGLKGFRLPKPEELAIWITNPSGRAVQVPWDDEGNLVFARRGQPDANMIDPVTLEPRRWHLSTPEEIAQAKVLQERATARAKYIEAAKNKVLATGGRWGLAQEQIVAAQFDREEGTK